ncbi:MAG: hypothetical protein H8E48_02430 [Chloroflexi bacterium]|nr:hypothetical protein [Chloroflexota bacterium]MBC8279619.1 hypothetical protein [Chloroflexota bacterium]
MTTTTNIQMNTNTSKEGNMNRSMFIAPRFSNQTIKMFVFGYLTMVLIILFSTGNPFQTTAALDLSPHTVSASTQTVVVEIPEVQIPAAPYIIIGSAN